MRPLARPLPWPPVQLITGRWSDPGDLRARVEAALRGGIRWVQLRAKERPARELHAAATMLVPILREAGAMLVVNDRVDVAVAAGADGVHLPENGFAARDAQRLLAGATWLGRSLHSVRAIAAHAHGVSAIQFGPVFDTPSKREHGPPQGLTALMAAAAECRAADVALVAVGGITPQRAEACRNAGADAVAVIGAIWDAPDIESAARLFARGWPRP